MIVSHEHKFCYLDPPKTASVSMSFALAPYATTQHANRVLPVRPHSPTTSAHHIHLRQQHSTLATNADFLASRPDDWVTMSVVRNPWSRFVSLYHSILDPNESVNDCAVRLLKTGSHRSVYGSPVICLVPQAAWAEGVDMLIRYENLDADFAAFCSLVNIDPIAYLPHLNHLHDDDWRNMYTREGADAVAAMAKTDLLKFAFLGWEEPACR